MNDRYETVLAFVAPIGADTERLQASLRSFLDRANYKLRVYRLSDEIRGFLEGKGDSIPSADTYKRYKALINGGNQIRKDHGNDAVAAMAVANIFASRKKSDNGDALPFAETAHAFISLKHVAEVLLTAAEIRGSSAVG